MIRSLRQRHRHAVIALGILLPVTYAIGLAARKPAPTISALPPALATVSPSFAAWLWKRDDLFAKTGVSVQLLREQATSGRFAFSFSAAKDFVKPDLLVYWLRGNAPATNSWPADAVLLGAFSQTVLPVPDDVAKSSGSLILYSLADDEIVAGSAPFQLPTSSR